MKAAELRAMLEVVDSDSDVIVTLTPDLLEPGLDLSRSIDFDLDRITVTVTPARDNGGYCSAHVRTVLCLRP